MNQKNDNNIIIDLEVDVERMRKKELENLKIEILNEINLQKEVSENINNK